MNISSIFLFLIEYIKIRYLNSFLCFINFRNDSPTTDILVETNSTDDANHHTHETVPKSTPQVQDGPYQPTNFEFPKRTFGNDPKLRSFQSSWFQKYSWLHYNASLDKVFCHTCMKAIRLGKVIASNSEESFTKTGFQNWKKALGKDKGFQKHNDGKSHIIAQPNN